MEDKESLPFVSGGSFWLVGDRFPELQAGRGSGEQRDRGRGLQGQPAVPAAGALQREARFQLAAAAPAAVGWAGSWEPALLSLPLVRNLTHCKGR